MTNSKNNQQEVLPETPYTRFKKVAYLGFLKFPVEELKDRARELMDNHEDGAGLTFSVLLDYLEEQMTESDFVEFCDNL